MTDPATADPAELAKFEAMAAEWWDPRGKFRPLHAMNPCRMDYIVAQVTAEFDRDRAAQAPLAGLCAVDIGCGGGLVAEPLARLGAAVTGIDAAGGTLPVARHHAQAQGLAIDYRQATAADLGAEARRFDIVLALEVVEHVPDPAAFAADCAALLRPGGILIASTLNRTAASFAKAIVGAEWVLGWLPRGTHDWRRFLKPEDLAAHLTAAGLRVVDRKGMVFDPLADRWSLSATDLSVNYAMTAVKPA